MSRILTQRTAVIAAATLTGVVLLEGVGRSLLREAPPEIWWPAALLGALIAASLAAILDARLSRPARPSLPPTTDNQRLQAELDQLNQELAARSEQQVGELARLNTELQLQMVLYRQAEETARVNEERFRNMADNIQEGLTILEDCQLVYLNERACEIFGDCPDGDLRARLLAFAAPDERPRLEALLAGGDDPCAELPPALEYWIERQDGARRYIRERYTRSAGPDTTRTFIVTSDITEAHQAYETMESAVHDRTRELSTVLDISARIASTLDLEPLLHLILDQIQTVIPYSGAAIFTLEQDQLYLAACQIPEISISTGPLYLRMEEAGPYRQVVEDKQVVIIADVSGSTPLLRALQERGASKHVFPFYHARGWIGIPLVIRGQVTGLLALTYWEPNYYTQQHARLGMTIANQVATAIENARLYEQAQNLAVLEERRRIARELHDSVTQLLYGITLYSSATSRKLRSAGFNDVEQNLAEIKDNALQALQEMRLLILEMDPPMLQKAGLAAALKTSLEVIESRTGLSTRLNTNSVERLPRPLETELYRIAMEALNNLVRYAKAKEVSVELSASDGWVWLEIHDNGVGFDLSAARGSGGMGLDNMEQRARQIQGTLEITSRPGAGTRIRVEAPVFAAQRTEARRQP